MKNKITINTILEAAEKNNLVVTNTDHPGLFIGEEKVEANELFFDIYQELNSEDKIALSMNISLKKEKSKLNFKHVTTTFANDDFGAA